MNGSICYLNGHLLPASEVRISPFDRGFTLGDGLFETIRVYNGQPFRLADHLARLNDGAQVLGLALPTGLDVPLAAVIAANGWTSAVLRLTVTRGAVAATRGGLLPDPELPPTVLVTGRDLVGHPPYPERFYCEGMRLATCGPYRDERSPLSGLKTLNYLPQVLLRQAAAQLGADEALQLNGAGDVVGFSVGNIFMVHDGIVLTPSLDCGPLPGVTRLVVLELARAANISMHERPISPSELAGADEVFLTNSLLEIAPVAAIDTHSFSPIPGPITALLSAALGRLVAGAAISDLL